MTGCSSKSHPLSHPKNRGALNFGKDNKLRGVDLNKLETIERLQDMLEVLRLLPDVDKNRLKIRLATPTYERPYEEDYHREWGSDTRVHGRLGGPSEA